MYVGRPAVMVLAILAARHRTFVLVVTSLFVLFVFCMHNKFVLLLLLQIHHVTGGSALQERSLARPTANR